MELSFRQMELYVALFALNILSVHSSAAENAYIYDHSRDVMITEGKQTFLYCTIGNFDQNRHEIRWWVENSVRITDSGRFKFTSQTINGGDERASVEISDVRRSDAKNYKCEIFDFVSKNSIVYSDKIPLNVREVPDNRYPMCKRNMHSFQEGEQAELSCWSEKSNPQPQLTWTKNGKMITNTDNIREVIEGERQIITYTFEPQSSDDGATFHCQLRTDADRSLLRNCTISHIRVRYKPKVSIMAEQSFVGKESVFICHITAANPQVDTYKWTTDPVIPSNRYRADDHTFRLFKPQLSDNGTTVTCSVKNSVGMASNDTVLDVRELLLKPKQPTADTVVDKKNIHSTSTERSLSYIVFISIGVVLCLLIIMLIPIFYIQCCKNSWDLLGREIVQPDVYFEPKDRILRQLPEGDQSVRWMRSIGVQVPQDAELAYIYHEIRENQRSGSSNSSCTRL